MDELKNLEYLSLVSKICTELDNHLGINDKVLAEFLIHLAQKSPSYEVFRTELIENEAELPDSFSSNLYRIVQKMLPTPLKKVKAENSAEYGGDQSLQLIDVALRKAMCPVLCRPNDPSVRTMLDEEIRPKKLDEKDTKVVDDMMGELESMLKETKADQTVKRRESSEEDDRKRKHKHHRRRSPESKHDRKKSSPQRSKTSSTFIKSKSQSQSKSKSQSQSKSKSFEITETSRFIKKISKLFTTGNTKTTCTR